jgi:hypothetical protein
MDVQAVQAAVMKRYWFAGERRFIRYVVESPLVEVDLVIYEIARQGWANARHSTSLRLGELLSLSRG